MCRSTPSPAPAPSLPAPARLLARLTDAHCHPTDMDLSPGAWAAVALRGVAAMSTNDEDQDKVAELVANVVAADADPSGTPTTPRLTACFGYHPWFAYRYMVIERGKHEHYTAVLTPTSASASASASASLLAELIPHLPEPIPFAPLLSSLRSRLVSARQAGIPTMVGEIGLDGSARLRWPESARLSSTTTTTTMPPLTPFKTVLSHQVALARLQLELAIELDLNVSFHCVSASAVTMDLLRSCRAAAAAADRDAFDRVNIDIHSCGGWSPPFLSQAVNEMANLYFSPSTAITARAKSAATLVKAVPDARLLVESDTGDLTRATALVWDAAVWIAQCKGWNLETDDGDDDDGDCQVEADTDADAPVWTVRTLESNWTRFMRVTPTRNTT